MSTVPRKNKTSRTLWAWTGKESDDTIHKAAKALVEILKAAHPKPVTRDELLSLLAAQDLGTTQKPIRVLYHWKKHLKDNGFIATSQQESVKKATEAPVLAPQV